MPIFASILWGILCTFPVFFVTLYVHTFTKKNSYEKAIKAGKKICRTNGVLTKSYRATNIHTGHWETTGIYTYEYKGKKYKYKMVSNTPPNSVSLSFFEDYPQGATSGVMPTTKPQNFMVWFNIAWFIASTCLSYLVMCS